MKESNITFSKEIDTPPWLATVLTLYPEMFPGQLKYALAGRALENRLWQLNVINIRDFASDKHGSVDDTPFGGGHGMVIRADVVDAEGFPKNENVSLCLSNLHD